MNRGTPADKLSAPRAWSQRLYLRLAPRDVAMLRFLIEAYDNLAYVTIVDRFSAVAKITFAPGSEKAVRRFLADAGETLRLEVLAVGDPPYAGCQNAAQQLPISTIE